MTFQQYLEGRKIWDTRDPDYDINLAADFSDDENNAFHFLFPFMKKVKAFAWYCKMVVNELQYPGARWDVSYSRRQQEPGYVYASRIAALHNMVGFDEPGANRLHVFTRDNVHKLSIYLDDLHGAVQGFIMGERKWDIPHSVGVILPRIYQSIDLILDSEHLGDKIKDRIQRIKAFLEKSQNQLKRVLTLKDSPGNTKVSNIFGKKVKW